MRRLLDRVLGPSSPSEREPDTLVHPIPAARNGPASNGSIEASCPSVSRGSVIGALRHRVAEGSRGRVSAQEIHEDAQLFDRGYLDSFSYVEFLVFIERTYRIRIDDSQLAGRLNTIAAVADHILREQTAPRE